MLDRNHRIAYRLHTLLQGTVEHPAARELSYYLVGEGLEPNEFFVQRYVHAGRRARSLATFQQRLPLARDVQCYAALEDEIREVKPLMRLLIQDVDYVELYKITEPSINRPAITTQLLVREGAVRDGAMFLADEVIRTFQNAHPELTSAAFSTLRDLLEHQPATDEWEALSVLHELHRRLLPSDRYLPFTLFSPPVSRQRFNHGYRGRSLERMLTLA